MEVVEVLDNPEEVVVVYQENDKVGTDKPLTSNSLTRYRLMVERSGIGEEENGSSI